MSSMALPAMGTSTLARIRWWLISVPYRSLGLYLPQALLALPAAYASSQFAAHHGTFPFPFNVMLGIAFEWVYLGTLAVAGAQRGNRWYKIVNGMAVVTSIIYVAAHAADKYGLLATLNTAWWQWTFVLIHGVPLAGLNFVYGMLIHTHLKGVAEDEAATAHKCDWCGMGFRSPAAINGHKKGCPSRPD